MSEPVIALAQVGLSFDARPVFVDADLAVAAGEAVVVGAPVGAGASSLCGLLTGERAGSGAVRVGGRALGRLRASSLVRLRRRMGVIPEDLQLIADATAAANVALALAVAGVRGRDAARRVDAALTAVAVAGHHPVAALSRAARQRVAWARALVREPDIVIADQPTCHQDGDGTARFVELLAARVAAGAAAVIASRDPALIAAAGARGWRLLTIHQHRLVDPATVVVEPIDAAPLVEAEISRPVPVPDDAVPNVVPFPVARSAGNRR